MNRRRTPTDGRTEEVSTRAPIKSLIFLDFCRGLQARNPSVVERTVVWVGWVASRVVCVGGAVSVTGAGGVRIFRILGRGNLGSRLGVAGKFFFSCCCLYDFFLELF